MRLKVFFALALVWAMLFSGFAVRSTRAPTIAITEKPIATNVARQAFPDIYGNIIVWQDNRSGNWDIYMYDLSTATEKRITTNTYDQWHPAVYGNIIVWVDDRRYFNWDIYMYDLSTATETPIIRTGHQMHPDVYGNIIVWADTRNSYPAWDIYMYNMSTSVETRIPGSTTRYVPTPAIYGNIIVWDGWNYSWGRFDLCICDLSTSTTTRITNYDSPLVPAVCGNIVVWDDYSRNDNWDIYMYDLSTSTIRRITTNTAHQAVCAVYGNIIVWTDTRNGNQDIYIYDLSTSAETQITTNTASQHSPAIYGNMIVWIDCRNGNYDVYMAELSFVSMVEAVIDVDPDTLNSNSNGKWITAYIQLPEDYSPADIDATTVLLNDTVSPVLDLKYDFVANSSEYLVDDNGDGVLERMVKFDRAAVEAFIISHVISYGNATLTLTGKLLDGTQFEGADIIFVNKPYRPHYTRGPVSRCFLVPC